MARFLGGLRTHSGTSASCPQLNWRGAIRNSNLIILETAKHYKLNVHVSKLSEEIIQLQLDKMMMMISYSSSSRQILKEIAILQAKKRL